MTLAFRWERVPGPRHFYLQVVTVARRVAQGLRSAEHGAHSTCATGHGVGGCHRPGLKRNRTVHRIFRDLSTRFFITFRQILSSTPTRPAPAGVSRRAGGARSGPLLADRIRPELHETIFHPSQIWRGTTSFPVVTSDAYFHFGHTCKTSFTDGFI